MLRFISARSAAGWASSICRWLRVFGGRRATLATLHLLEALTPAQIQCIDVAMASAQCHNLVLFPEPSSLLPASYIGFEDLHRK